MSKFIVINPKTGHAYGCICDRCVSQSVSVLLNLKLAYRPPLFDADFSNLPWPDELQEEEMERERRD